MWRAWGIVLLLLSPQDLGIRAVAPDHEIALRPPAGWTRYTGSGPTVVKFRQPGELPVAAELIVAHLTSSNPTPLETFKKQARDNIKEKYAGAQILEEKDLTLAGKHAYRLVFSHGELIFLKTVVHRSNVEYYLLDAAYPPTQAEKVRPVIEASIASLEIVPATLSPEDRVAESKALGLLKGAKIDPALLGEKWFAIHLGARKVGHMRLKIAESEGMYSFDSEVKTDFGDGNTDSTTARGQFSPDGRSQKVDSDQVKVNPKQKWQFKVSASIQEGKARITRDLNGVQEERSFPVEEGVVLNDVLECLRPVIVGGGKGVYLVKVLSPYSDEWTPESLEVSGLENLEFYGKPTDCILVMSGTGIRRRTTYTYLPDRSLYRVGGPKDAFSVRASTKEEVLKK
ncbi:MAG TPA: hypothetical protein VM222_05770 [Planctomycetota bacterium]|nr:hypothetical protein [Planctomycetota bacterium]